MASETQLIAQLACPSHSSLIYQSPDDQTAVTAEFLARGLTRGEMCVFLDRADRMDSIRDALSDSGIDVSAEEKRGALKLSSDRSFLNQGRFDGARILAVLDQALQEALTGGFLALRATGDMNWEMGDDKEFQLLVDYEAELDQFVHQRRIVGLCQYRRHSLSGLAIRNALETHENVILGKVLCENNFYYEPPEIRLNRDLADAQEKRIEWMCRRLEKASQVERQHFRAIEALVREQERLGKNTPH